MQEQFVDDVRARRNSFLLAAAQSLYGVLAMNIIATGVLAGHMLADDKGLATVPITGFVTGTATFTIPASLFMRRVGRRVGFMCGAGFGFSGAMLGAYALYIQSFWLFTFSAFLCGAYQAFAQYYRFAAADIASDGFKSKAISWVLVGGLFAALFGPFVILGTKDAFAPVLFMGAYVASAGLAVVAMVVLAFVDIPVVRESGAQSDARPLKTVLMQPRLLIAIFCGMASYGMMNLMMTATPLAMVNCGFTVDHSTWVIQWHALAMYVPSFFTGHLINRFGKERVIAAGMVLLTACGIVALSGISMAHFGFALVFLGLGWNFGFVGATSMVTDCYRPSERNKVQAVNDFCVFGLVALASFTSGKLLDIYGWDAVALALFPVIAITLVLIGWLVFARLPVISRRT